jgi:hypothetical protein
MTMRTTTVIGYIVQRLVDEGITQCFGVPRDYAFPVCDALERNPKSTGSAAQTKCIWRSFRPALNTGMKPRRLKQPETSTTKHLLLKRRSHVL